MYLTEDYTSEVVDNIIKVQRQMLTDEPSVIKYLNRSDPISHLHLIPTTRTIHVGDRKH